MIDESGQLDYTKLLSEEELNFLDKINTKVYEAVEAYQKEHKFDHLNNDSSIDFADKHPDIIHKEHITDCPHEMRITVESKISSIDNKGNLSEVKDLNIKHFHIPIPSNTNYINISNKFFETFQQKLLDTCREIINPLVKNETE